MEHRDYLALLKMARRLSRRPDEAEDLLHAALLVAVESGRVCATSENRRWFAGVLRHQAALAARGAIRARQREAAWQHGQPAVAGMPEPTTRRARASADGAIANLPPALRIVALLAVSGHTRGEIRHLLRLSDQALRQRLTQVRRRLALAGCVEWAAAVEPLAFGRIRSALLPLVRQARPHLASHDPDGHLFAIGAHKPPPLGNIATIQGQDMRRTP